MDEYGQTLTITHCNNPHWRSAFSGISAVSFGYNGLTIEHSKTHSFSHSFIHSVSERMKSRL